MNELIESWEEGAGVREFVILTAQSSEAHLEALSTIRTDEATVQVVDVFSLDFGSLLERPGAPIQGGELDTSLLLFLAPELVRMELAQRLRDHARDARPLPAGTQPAAAPGLARIGRISQPRLRPEGGAACIDLSSNGSAAV